MRRDLALAGQPAGVRSCGNGDLGLPSDSFSGDRRLRPLLKRRTGKLGVRGRQQPVAGKQAAIRVVRVARLLELRWTVMACDDGACRVDRLSTCGPAISGVANPGSAALETVARRREPRRRSRQRRAVSASPGHRRRRAERPNRAAVRRTRGIALQDAAGTRESPAAGRGLDQPTSSG